MLFVLVFGLFASQFLEFVSAVEIPVVILYEKSFTPQRRAIAKMIADATIEKHNKALSQDGLEIRLKGIKDYSQFSKDGEYAELISFVGTELLKERLEAIQKLQGNIVMLYSSPASDSPKYQREATPCQTKLLANMDKFESIEDGIKNAITDWLENLFGAGDSGEIKSSHILDHLSHCGYFLGQDTEKGTLLDVIGQARRINLEDIEDRGIASHLPSGKGPDHGISIGQPLLQNNLMPRASRTGSTAIARLLGRAYQSGEGQGKLKGYQRKAAY